MHLMNRLIIGISGASGVIYGIRLLEMLKDVEDIETHLVVTNGGKLNISLETDFDLKDIEQMADVVHSDRNLGASIASGSFETTGMIIAPCSMKTLSAVVNSYAANLIVRAADVILKEKRQLIIIPRETPLHLGHTELFYKASLMGAHIVPPNPAFYNNPESIDDIINHTVGRVLDLAGVDNDVVKRWKGVQPRMSSDSLQDIILRVQEFLNNHNTVSIASKNNESVWAATVFYIADTNMNLYFLSSDKTQHISNIQTDENVAITVYKDVEDWQSIQGLQGSGRVSEVASSDRDKILADYIKKYVFLDDLLQNPKDDQEKKIAEQFSSIGLYVYKPNFFRIIDNSISFGFKQELVLKDDSWAIKPQSSEVEQSGSDPK